MQQQIESAEQEMLDRIDTLVAQIKYEDETIDRERIALNKRRANRDSLVQRKQEWERIALRLGVTPVVPISIAPTPIKPPTRFE